MSFRTADLRNKKRKICHYLHSHDLSEDVRRSLIQKVDQLEHMIQTMEVPYRKKRHYYQMLDQEIKKAVSSYLNDLAKNTMTVLEKLDIREFNIRSDGWRPVRRRHLPMS